MPITVPDLVAVALLGLGGWAAYVLTHPEKPMTVRKRDHYRQKVTKEPFQLELDAKEPSGGDGEMRQVVVTFRNPHRLPFEDAITLNESGPVRQMELLLGDDFDRWWEEWHDAPADEVNKLSEDVMEYYGAGPKALRTLPR